MALLITGVGFTSVANAADIPDFNNIGDGTTSTVTAEFYKDNKGTPFDPATDKLKPGDTLYGKVTIKFSDADKPTLDNLNISYTFPDNIDVKNVEEGDLYADGALAGTWLIKNNVAMFKYNEDWLKNHHSDISAYVNFDFTLNNNPSETGDGTKIHFPGTKGDVTIVTDKSELGGKKTWKLNDDGTVTFSVTLNNKFDAKNVVVTDTMGSDFVFRNGSFALDGTALPAGNVSINGQVATVTLGDLKTGKHTLTYTADLSDAAKQMLLVGGKLNNAKNTARWTWEGSEKPGEDDTTPQFSYNMISKKDGTGTADDIAWEVTLNSGDLKADMGGYVFTDTLKGGQHYKGTFEVVDSSNNWTVIDTGTIADTATSFTYTFGQNAGKKQYLIRYHTKLDDPSSMDKVSNKGEVTPPDEGKPGGSDEGSFQPTDTKTYVTKQIDKNTAATDGKVEWSSLVKMSLMDKGTIPTKIKFIDNGLWGAGITFDMDKKPVLTLGSKTLVEGTDYTLTYEKKSINITFKDSADIRGAIGSTDVRVTYWTIGDTAPGYYGNTAQVKLNGTTTSASAQYNIEKSNLVEKSGSMKWDKNFKWSDVDPADTTVGAWVAIWTVQANINQSTNEHGKVDVAGQPITITDTLPQGMSYVPGSATYNAHTDWWPHRVEGKEITPTITGGTMNFSIDTKDLTRDDGTCFAYAEVTYKTVAKSTGKDVVFSNHAEAGSGSTNFGSSDATVKGTTKVIDKSGKQVDNSNHIKYTIKVNPQGADLIKNNDTLTLTDVMDAKATFVNSSLKTANSLTGAIVTAKATVDSVKDKDGNPTTKLTIDLPDSTPITVTYEVIPSGKAGDKVHLSNTAQLSGVEEGSSTTKNDWTIHNAGAGTVGAAGTLQINKADASDLSRPLKGAKFELYKVDMSRLPAGTVSDEQVRAASTKVLDGTTNVDGIVTFGSHTSPLETNVLYFFVETAAPTWKDSDGSTTSYELDPSLHYVMLKGADKDTYDVALKQAKNHGITPSANQTYNVYDKRKPAEAKATVTLGKQLTGRAWKDTDSFKFKLEADKGNSKDVTEDELTAAMPETKTADVTNKGGADGSAATFTFGGFTFKKAGTYAYTVKETTATSNGVKPDSRTATVKFTVTEDVANATFKVTRTVTGIDNINNVPTFVNTYKPTATKAEVKASKNLTGRDWNDEDTFKVGLVPVTDGAPMPKDTTTDSNNTRVKLLNMTKNNHEGVSFGDITFDKADTYVYNVYEVDDSSAGKGEPGISYSQELYRVTFTVTDNQNGKLEVARTIARVTQGGQTETPVTGDTVSFTNKYEENEQELGLSAIKRYHNATGSKPNDGKLFRFQLTGSGDAPMPEGATDGIKTVYVNKSEATSFGQIKFKRSRDAGKTYTYTMQEVVPADAKDNDGGTATTSDGMTYDKKVYTVTVKCELDKDQQFKVTPSYQIDGKDVTKDDLVNGVPVFDNTYKLMEAKATINGSKTLVGRDSKANEQFSFTLTAASDDTTEAKAAREGLKNHAIVFGTDQKAEKMTADVSGLTDGTAKDFSFGDIIFTKVGVYKFTVTEDAPNDASGMTYDRTTHTVTVTVTDNGDGTLQAVAAYDAGSKASFTNTYTASGSVAFKLNKKLTDTTGAKAPELTAGEFSFGLYQGGGTDGTKVQTKSNAADGAIAFDAINYTPQTLAQAVTDGYATYDAAEKIWTVTYTAAELDNGSPVTGTVVKNGITYDATTRKLVVTVKDGGNGTLNTSYIVSDGDESIFTDPDSNGAPFTNTYTPAPTTAQLYAQKKLIGRDWQNGDSFDFTLAAVDNAPMPVDATNGELTRHVTDSNEFGFGEMTYTRAGTYVYNISEITPEQDKQIPGISYSYEPYQATVTVTDNGKGVLSASVTMKEVFAGAKTAVKTKAVREQDGHPTAVITNTYSQLSQQWGLVVRKNYMDNSGDNPLAANKFSFSLKALNNAPLPAGADGNTVTAKVALDGKAFFPNITYTDKDLGKNGASKTYSYEVRETKGNEQGMTYDATVYTVEVTVSLENGTLKVTHVVKDKNGNTVLDGDKAVDQPVFTNTYQPGAAKAELKAKKTLNNAQLKDGQFSFALTGAKNSDGTVAVPMPEGATDGVVTKTNDADGGVDFGSISYDKVGTYNYTLAEVVPQGAANNVKDGITYDTVQHQVQVNVTLNKASGKLVAQVTYANDHYAKSAQFTNAYNANGSATLSAKKSFKNSDGSDRTIPENAFTFQLHEGATATGKLLQTKVVAADGTVNFDPITYSLKNLDSQSSKDFTYTVTEATPANTSQLPGVAYDNASHTYTVTVTNDGNGKLNTVVKADGKTVTGTANVPVFTNTYSASGSTAIAGTKMVTGDDGKNYTDAFGGKFTFTLTGKDGAPIHVASTEDGSDTGALKDVAKLTAKNNADGTVTFDSLHYSLADLTGVPADGNGVRSKTFTYEVTESGNVDGVTNDAETVKTFTVTVADKGTGKLEVTTSPVDTAKLFSFKNAYVATAEFGLTGTKTMTGRALKEGESYTFNVYEGTDTTGTPVSTGTSDANGKITFDKTLDYSLKDLGDHTYTVVESEENLPGGVSAVTKTHTFTVKVEDMDHNGKLKVTAEGLSGNNGLSFENNYATTDSTPIELKGVKLLDDGDYDTTLAQLEGKFTFTLKGEDGAPLHVVASEGRDGEKPTTENKTELTAENDEAGNVDFGKVVYTFADLNGQTERTFTYAVTESGKVAGVTNDTTLTRTFTVTIKDNGDGTMSATAAPAEGPLFTFTNAYSGGETTDAFDFTKTLDGRDLNDGEFTFTLTGGTDKDGNAVPMPKGAKDGVATATNAADGKIAFGEITYAKPGTYTYTVRETAGDLGGVTYDDTVYTVTVTVKDNHDGTMSATHEITRAAQSGDKTDGKLVTVKPEDATFANSYAPAPTTFTFDATKTMNGRALKDGEFSFELRDADGKTVETVKNSANGKIAFTPVEFAKAGDYEYTIREVSGSATGVTYDKTVYTAKVSVVDNLDGTMSATATYSSGLFGTDHKAPAFENTFTPPLSKTGADMAGVMAMVLLLLGGGVTILMIERRNAAGLDVASSAPRGRHGR